MKIRKLLPLLVMLLIAGGAVAFILTRGSIGVQELLAWSPENKWLAALAALAAYALKSQTVVVPYALIATAVGLIFDLPAALAVNTLGSVVCISLPYLTRRTGATCSSSRWCCGWRTSQTTSWALSSAR